MAYDAIGDRKSAFADYDRAIVEFTRATESGRQRWTVAEIYRSRGLAYLQKSQYDKAIADFTKAIELDPTYGLAYSNRGVVYDAIDQSDQALSDYNRAIEVDPNL